MRLQLFKSRVRILSSILAVSILLSSIPLTGGVIIVSGPGYPEFTINICHPIQSFDRVPDTVLARPALMVPHGMPLDHGAVAVEAPARLVERNLPPDTPPPKSLV